MPAQNDRSASALPANPTPMPGSADDGLVFEAPRDLGPVRVAVVRFKGSLRKTLEAADNLKPTDGVLLRDVVEGKAKNEIVHRGDFIVLFGGRFWKEKPAAEKDHPPTSK